MNMLVKYSQVSDRHRIVSDLTWIFNSKFFHWQKRVYLSLRAKNEGSTLIEHLQCPYLSRNCLNGSPLRKLNISSIYGCKEKAHTGYECHIPSFLFCTRTRTSNKLGGTSLLKRCFCTWSTASLVKVWKRKNAKLI